MDSLKRRKHYPEFKEWLDDGNVIKLEDGYATQCAQYQNRLKTRVDLYEYFIKEFIN